MPTIKQYFTLKKITLFLTILLPIFFILFLAGGCSFKLIDPQYYRFLSLCKNVDSEVTIYNQDYFDIIKNSKNIKTNDKGCFYSEKLEQEICFGGFAYSKSNRVVIEYNKFGLKKSIQKRYYNDIHYLDYTLYVYTYYGLFLRGDEGRGWHWETEDSLECSIMDNY